MEMIAENDNGTNMMHEGINVNDPSKYTRPWFSWANSMFCVCGSCLQFLLQMALNVTDGMRAR